MTALNDAALQCLRTIVMIPCIAIAVGFYIGFFARAVPGVLWLRSNVIRYGGALASIAAMLVMNTLLARLLF